MPLGKLLGLVLGRELGASGSRYRGREWYGCGICSASD
jgi:hypothetical protein